MSLFAGVRSGLRVGVRSGLNPSDSGIAGVTRDGSNGRYYPASTAESSLLMAAAGLATGNPDSIWNCQEPSGNLADSGSAGLTLTAFVVGWTYQQTFTGATRRCVRGVDGTANQRFANTAAGANPAAVSVLQLMSIDFPATPPADVSGIWYVDQGVTVALRMNTSGNLRIVAGANAETVNTYHNTRGLIALRNNVTAGTITLFTELEKLTGTYVLPGAGANAAFGGAGGASGPVTSAGYGHGMRFTGAPAELSDAQMKTLFQTLTGATIPWT
jgi:hypothetical protein